MKNNTKLSRLIEWGLSPQTVSKLTESQVDVLYSKFFLTEQKETKEAVTKNTVQTTYSGSEVASMKSKGESIPGGSSVKVNADGGITVTKEGEMSEGSGKEDSNNPWSICTAQLGKEFGTTERSKWNKLQMKKYESCVKDVKKSLKEGKNPVTLFVENKIMELLNTHLPPKITKKDLLKYLNENNPAEAPVKNPKPKPGTKEPPAPVKKPIHPGKNPNPDVQPSPKAKDAEQAKDAIIDTIMKILKNG
jgi:hypothetical protein